ncbi:MAG: VCBS repeat-containing protein [Planctomycetes bacterium]|nr:VCBS repeat-containing protein [Planctomycetota bacterium]
MRLVILTSLIALSLTPLGAQVGFTLDQTLPLSSTTPWLYGDYLQLVDVTGDGVRDLLVIDSANLESYEYQGGTGFIEIATTPLPSAGTLAVVADLNSDGKTDALVRLASGYVSMLGDGAGGFTLAGSYSATTDGGQVLVGDFNGDGILDAATARDTGGVFGGVAGTEVSIRLGDGTGTFGAPTLSSADVGLNYAVVIDLDENGTDDLILSGVAQLTFAFFDGGALLNFVNYPAGAGDAPQDIRTRDLNGDGHLDVVFTCPLLDRVGVLILDGTGLLGIFDDYTVSGSPVTLRAGDINGDAIPDLLTTTVTGFEWRLGLGDGTFGGASSTPLASNQPRFAVGDSTSDGLAEIAILSGNDVSILLNTTSTVAGEFLRGDANIDGQVGIADAVRTLEALFLPGTPPLECSDAGDVNDDGSLDISDAAYLLGYLFIPGSPEPPAPGALGCGADPTADALQDCTAVPTCP